MTADATDPNNDGEADTTAATVAKEVTKGNRQRRPTP